jgi:peptide/nickel transport system permease protein
MSARAGRSPARVRRRGRLRSWPMGRFLRTRLLSALLVLAVVSAASFALIWMVPGDVAASLADPGASAEELERIRARLGLDKPKAQQVLEWYANLARGSLGDSILLNRPVTAAILERLPVTLTLATLAFAIALVVGVTIGIVAATRHGSWVDQVAMTVGVVGLSIPEFWLALMAIVLFAVHLNWLPASGFVPFGDSVSGWARSLALPVGVLAVTQIGLVARMTRSAMLEVLGLDYIRTARAKGLPATWVVLKHAFRNALIPVLTVAGVIFGVLLGGAVVVEQVFALPGVGRLIIDGVLRRDYPVIQGGLLFLAAIYVAVNLAVDLLYGAIDPRVRPG